MGCIMEALFIVLMWRGSFVSMYTWLQRMEISCGVKVTFSPVIPLSFLLSAAPSFGVFLRRMEWTCTKEGPWQQRWQRGISKERLLIHCLGPEHLQNASRKGADFCWCLLNLIKNRSYHRMRACTIWKMWLYLLSYLFWPVILKCNKYGTNEKTWNSCKRLCLLKVSLI